MINNTKYIRFKYSLSNTSFPKESLLFIIFTDFPLYIRGSGKFFTAKNGLVLSSEIRPELDLEENILYGPGEQKEYDEDVCYYYNRSGDPHAIETLLKYIQDAVNEYNQSIIGLEEVTKPK